MGTDLIAWAVAIGLGVVVVAVGLRRDLSETTRSNLPRFGEDSESASATVGLWEGEQRGRPLPPRQARWLALPYLLLGLLNAADAALSSDGRLLHMAAAAVLVLAAVVLVPRMSRRSSGAAR